MYGAGFETTRKQVCFSPLAGGMYILIKYDSSRNYPHVFACIQEAAGFISPISTVFVDGYGHPYYSTYSL